jgi:tripartite-type tricarboxylate transporter receptor subunit TctC
MQVGFDIMPATLEYVRAGKLRALAVTTATRSLVLPDVPTVGDFVPGYEASSWHGIGVPKNTPADIIEKLNDEINAVLADPKVIARLAEFGGVPMPMTPVQFGQFVANETDKWAKVVTFAGIKPE